MPEEWNSLGEGSYNRVYINNERTLVLKIQKTLDLTDTPERSVRLWNLLNPHINPPARQIITEKGKGWVCPYIEGSYHVTDDEMKEVVIEIFNRTGRILVDAPAKDNFIKTNPPDSQIVCVDFGLALELERREEVLYQGTVRRKSIVSLDAWENTRQNFPPFFKKSEQLTPLTVKIIKALLLIKSIRPDICNADFLKGDPDLTSRLAHIYDSNCHWLREEVIFAHELTFKELDRLSSHKVITIQPPNFYQVQEPETTRFSIEKSSSGTLPINESATPLLNEEVSSSLRQIKSCCEWELTQYLEAREQTAKAGDFIPSVVSQFFRNNELTAKKSAAVKKAIKQLEQIDSLSSLNALLESLSTPELLSSNYTYGLEQTIGKCKFIIANAMKDSDCELEESFVFCPSRK